MWRVICGSRGRNFLLPSFTFVFFFFKKTIIEDITADKLEDTKSSNTIQRMLCVINSDSRRCIFVPICKGGLDAALEIKLERGFGCLKPRMQTVYDYWLASL